MQADSIIVWCNSIQLNRTSDQVKVSHSCFEMMRLPELKELWAPSDCGSSRLQPAGERTTPAVSAASEKTKIEAGMKAKKKKTVFVFDGRAF